MRWLIKGEKGGMPIEVMSPNDDEIDPFDWAEAEGIDVEDATPEEELAMWFEGSPPPKTGNLDELEAWATERLKEKQGRSPELDQTAVGATGSDGKESFEALVDHGRPNRSKAVGVAMSSLGAFVGCCFILLNAFGGLVSGVWLLAKGEWVLVVLGFALGFLMPTAWGFAVLPAEFAGYALLADGKPRNRVALLAGAAMVSTWTAVLLCSWVAFVFILFTRNIEPGLAIPIFLWTYATIFSPLAYMASKEPKGNEGVGVAIGFVLALLSFLVLGVSYLAGTDRAPALIAVAAVGVMEVVFVTFLTSQIAKDTR